MGGSGSMSAGVWGDEGAAGNSAGRRRNCQGRRKGEGVLRGLDAVVGRSGDEAMHLKPTQSIVDN